MCWFSVAGKELWPERNFHARMQEQVGVERFHVVKGCRAGKLEGSDTHSLSDRERHLEGSALD